MGPAARKNGEEPRNCTGVSHQTSTKLHEINWVLLQKIHTIMGSTINRYGAKSIAETQMQRESLIKKNQFFCGNLIIDN